MPFLHSTPFVFQHPSQLAHTIPRYAYNPQTIQISEPTPKPAPKPVSTGLRGFYEHEEYERIERCLVERIENARKSNNNSPLNTRRLQACEQQLEDTRDKLVRAREKFASERESQHTPNIGEEDNVGSQKDHFAAAFKTRSFDSAVHLAPSDAGSAMSRLPSQDNDSAISVQGYNSDEEGLKLAVRPKIRMDSLPYLSRALLDYHSTPDANGFPYLTAQPTIVWSKDKQQWVEIRCNTCGAQSQDGMPLLGMAAMEEHVRSSHN